MPDRPPDVPGGPVIWLRVLVTHWVGHRLCLHRSHRLRLHCWRWAVHARQCGKHDGTCRGRGLTRPEGDTDA